MPQQEQNSSELELKMEEAKESIRKAEVRIVCIQINNVSPVTCWYSHVSLIATQLGLGHLFLVSDEECYLSC